MRHASKRTVVAFGLSVVVLSWAATIPRVAAGQSQSPASALEVLERLPLQDSIRFVSHGVRIRAGNPRIDGDSLAAIVHGHKQRFAAAEIDTLWVKRGSYGRVGAVITGVPAAIIGALWGNFLANDRDSGGKPGAGPQAAIVVGAVLGILGAIPGAIIGSSVPHWQRVYARTFPPG